MTHDRQRAADIRQLQNTADFPSTQSSLITRVRASDLAAWHNLVSLYGPLVYQWCRHKGLQDADAADVGQEVFRAVATSIERFRREQPGDTFRGWLWGITRNKLGDFWRRQAAKPAAEGGTEACHRWQQLADDAPAGDASEAPPTDMSDLFARSLALVRDQFEPTTWQAFWCVAIDGRPAADVAHELGLSVGAVYVAKSRVLRRLREELNDLEEIAE